MKTRELIDNKDGTIALRTVAEEIVIVTPEDVKALDEAKQREILYLENDLRVLQARLTDLQGEKAKTAELHARAVELAPVKVEEKPLEGGGAGRALRRSSARGETVMGARPGGQLRPFCVQL